MNKVTEQSLFRIKNKRLQDLSRAAIDQFRRGEDAAGAESLLWAVDQLEKIVENESYSQEPRIDLSRLLPVLRRLYFYIQNQDITGITDLLDDTFYPLTNEWLKGCDGT